MLFIRLYDEQLAQASYLIACQVTREALVVDPLRDPDMYLQRADEEDVRITHVTETHIHADFLSGSRELAERAGARLYLSGEGGPDWLYDFTAADGATVLRNGEGFNVGGVRVDARHTPGHTPEHLALVVTDTATASEPMGIFTGDFVFVGDVGRPDLLERTSQANGTSMEESARLLFRSLRAFAALPDYMQLWPGHGAGSACGKALGAVPQTTLGYEKRFNWAFQARTDEEFVAGVLDGQPDPPPYFARMKRLNRSGPPRLPASAEVPRLGNADIDRLLADGTMVVDTRPSREFAARHIPGTLALPRGSSFLKWAGWLLPDETPIALIVDGAARARAAARDLSLIGLDNLVGAFFPDVVDAWERRHGGVGQLGSTSVDEVNGAHRASGTVILDVRNDDEWNAGHIPGARHIPLGQLPGRLRELDPGAPITVHCHTGTRAAIGASMLERAGFSAVSTLTGGFVAWEAAQPK